MTGINFHFLLNFRLQDIRKTMIMMKEVAVDLERDGQSQMVSICIFLLLEVCLVTRKCREEIETGKLESLCLI